MKKFNLFFSLLLIASHLVTAQTWDILDKSMAEWDKNGNTDIEKSWTSYIGNTLKNNPTGYSISQQTNYVNLTKTYVNASASSALINSQSVTIQTNTVYTIEFNARINQLNKETYPDIVGTGWELNALSARINKQTTDLYLGYATDGRGYVTLKKDYPAAEKDRIYMDISGWHIYSFVLSADNTKYDVYVDGELVFENAATTYMNSATNILRFGTAAERARCNIDVESARMGIGDFYACSKIASIALSQSNHVTGNASTVSVTANTASINDGEKLLFSLIDENNNEVLIPVNGTVTNNTAKADIVIPANILAGQYYVKVSALNDQIGEIAVAPKTAFYLIKEDTPANIWDILDKSMAAWNQNDGEGINKAWEITKGKDISISPTQKDGYVNITKMVTKGSYAYGFLTPPELILQENTAYSFTVRARVNPFDKIGFPDTETTFESTEISARLNQKNMAIFLKYGNEGSGYISLTESLNHYEEDKYKINTSEWHDYRFVFHADNSRYDVYVDDVLKPIFENVATSSMTGSNILRLGTGSNLRCNLDIESVKMGTGDFYSTSKIVSVVLSSDSHVENNSRTISVNINTVLISNGKKLLVSLVDGEGNTMVDAIEAIVSQNKATTNFTIPATVAKGKYFIKVLVPGGKIGEIEISPKIAAYVIVAPSPIASHLFPTVSPVGFLIDIADYKYIGPSKEFISPSIIDTKLYVQDEKFFNGEAPLDRYYLFYSPHENPGGMFLMTGPTLDGPWKEQNTVIDLNWAKAIVGSNINTADHISACHVIWNDVYNKYFMYFHGPNTTTHYATSDNLKNWTFGKSILNAQDFGSRGNEASYSKAFEYKVPGLDNKYIILMMIAESSSSRRVYWAHSKDGIDWTGVRKPLLSADLDYKKIPGTDIKPNYVGSIGNNVAASFFMENNGRYFVFFNGSSGNICVAEVGEALDIEVHWGEYMKASEIIIDKDNNGNLVALPRAAAPLFITDDAGKWYMFFEAGGRLGANIAYAKEEGEFNAIGSPSTTGISIHPSSVESGGKLTVNAHNLDKLSVDIIDLSGNRISSTKINGSFGDVKAPLAPGLYLVKVSTNKNQVKISKITVR